jgi:CDP-diacylglycerol--glycerol-3-phosphate 3-phosphatidyltransferase
MKIEARESSFRSSIFKTHSIAGVEIVPAKYRDAFKLREFLYPANLLTLARLLMLPAAIRYMRQPDGRWRSMAVFGIAMATDVLDGPVARMRHEVSSLGKVLDPIADKLMINTTAIALSQTREFPWWATGLLITRDLAILLGGMLLYRRHAHISVAHPAGKITTVALAAAMLLYLADGPRSGRPALYAALVPFGASLVVYGKKFLSLLRHD